MSVLISGSMAFDHILSLQDTFADHILPNEIERLSVSFLAPSMRSDFGGCAGNIAYALHVLGGKPLPLATVGQDGQRYIQRLKDLGINTQYIAVDDNCYTAQCTIMTDTAQNQITSFHPGAMQLAHQYAVPTNEPIQLGIIAPNNKAAMQQHAQQLHGANIDFIFDPGQALTQFDGEELQSIIEQATWLVVNDYEASLVAEKMGSDPAHLSQQVQGLVVTHGGNGCSIWQQGVCTPVAAEDPKQAIDPTGCGDAWRGALLYGLQHGWDLLRCAKLGNYMGAIKVAHLGPQNYQIDPQTVAQY